MRNHRITPGLFLSPFPNHEMADKSPSQHENPNSNAPVLGFLEYLAEGVMILDSERVIRAVNSSLERMLGWGASELFGVRCQDIFDCQHPITTTTLCSNLCPLIALHTAELLKQPVH